MRNSGIGNSKQVVKQMKSVLVFGGARGIGRAVANAFVVEGFGVTVVARTRKEIDATVSEFSVMGEVQGYQADVSVYREVEEAVESHLAKFEGFDVVVNAAAIQGPIGPLWKNDPNHWAKNVSINLIGSFNVCRAVVPEMIKAESGAIILFSGGGAAYARPNFSAYGVTKTGVLRLVETINEELKEGETKRRDRPSEMSCARHGHEFHGVKMSEVRGKGEEEFVRVYAVAPGAVKTRMTEEVIVNKEEAGEKEFAEALSTNKEGSTLPEKAAQLCLFLARERPACLSGRLIHVNEPYREYVARFKVKKMGDKGMLRRMSFE